MDIAPEDGVLSRVDDRMLHRAGIIQVAKLLARQHPEYRGLTGKRVDTPRRSGHIQARYREVLSRAQAFRLGDVNDAHLAHATRERKAA